MVITYLYLVLQFNDVIVICSCQTAKNHVVKGVIDTEGLMVQFVQLLLQIFNDIYFILKFSIHVISVLNLY